MAKVQFGGGIAKISGKMAGNVFASNKGGAYMRRFSVPTNPNTAAQQGARDRLAGWSGNWRALTTEQQDAWNAWAQTHAVIDRLGASILLTGAQAYVKLNINAELASVAEYTMPPIDPTFKTPVTAQGSLVVNAGAQTVTVNAGVNLVIGDIIFYWASPPVSAGKRNTNELDRLIAVQTLAADVDRDDPLPELSDEYMAVFGNLTGQAGRAINLTAYAFSRGQLSVGSLTRGIIQA
jgi:hypothetical protein